MNSEEFLLLIFCSDVVGTGDSDSVFTDFLSTSDLESDEVRTKLGEVGFSSKSVDDSGVKAKLGEDSERKSPMSIDDALEEGSHSFAPSESFPEIKDLMDSDDALVADVAEFWTGDLPE